MYRRAGAISSYNQITEARTLGETFSLAVIEIMALHEELSDLCASIAAQFPKTYEAIPKYQEAYDALAALEDAKALLEEPMERVAPSYRQKPVVAVVGKQTRQNRTASERVRLGNAVVRLKAVQAALPPSDDLATDLNGVIASLQCVTFPVRYG